MLRDARTAKMQARIGDHHPIHSTALGKAILAFLPPAERAMILDWPLEEVTRRTIRSSAVLRRQLEEARLAGYSIEREEMEDGFSCIGVPILDHDNYPLAAMSLSVTDKRLMTVLTDAVAALETAALAISRQL
jgi:IclR family acetate operon transcriptional repressor